MNKEIRSFEASPETISQEEKELTEITELLSQKRNETVSQEALSLLVPQRVRDVAKNQNNIEIRPLQHEQGEVSIIVTEKDYLDELSSKESYSNWRQSIEDAIKNQEGKKIKLLPPAPDSVNRLHAKFKSEIDQGRLSLSDRVLMTCKLKLYPENQHALYVGDFDGEPHLGIGQEFYQNTLPTLAKKIGVRFIVGENNPKNITFFTKTLGRYVINDLKPESQQALFPNKINDQFFTIQFLYPEDIIKHVESK